MNIHTTKVGVKLSELATNLYKRESAHAPEPDVTAADALRSANPQLGKEKVIPPGTMIMVPEVPGYTYRPVADPGQDMATAAARQLRDVLGQVGEVLGSALDEREKNDQATARQLARMAKDDVALASGKKVADRLKSIMGATKERATDLADQRAVQAEGIAQVKKDLAEFLQIHGR
jgi:uncharacterized protein YjbJ (UPF0337 family)